MRAKAAGFWQSLIGYLLLDAIRRASFVLLLPVYLSTLEPDALGALVLYNVFAAVLSVIANLRLDASVRTLYFDLRGDREAEDHFLSGVFSLSFGLIITASLLMALLGPVIYRSVAAGASFQFYPFGIIAMATAFCHTALAPLFVFLRNRRDLKTFVCYSVFLIIGNVGLQLLCLVWLDLGLVGALTGALLPPAILLTWILVRRAPKLIRVPRWSEVSPAIRFSLPLVAFSILFLLEARLDRLFIERHLGLSSLGIYGVLAALLGLASMALNALDAAIRPWLYTALADPHGEEKARVATFYTFYVGCGLLTVSLIVMAGSSLSLLTDDPAYLSVRQWIPLGATALVPLLFTRYWGLLYLSKKKTARLTSWTLARTIATFVLLSLLVPRFGIPGALIALLVSQLLNAVVFRIELHRFGITLRSDAITMTQALTFLLILWGTWSIVPAENFLRFGILQFLLFLAVIAVFHYRTPRTLHQQLSEPEPEMTAGGVAP
ncbi:MAG: oligosaccharide flippase family protein [Pseudomonadota bacterium]